MSRHEHYLRLAPNAPFGALNYVRLAPNAWNPGGEPCS